MQQKKKKNFDRIIMATPLNFTPRRNTHAARQEKEKLVLPLNEAFGQLLVESCCALASPDHLKLNVRHAFFFCFLFLKRMRHLASDSAQLRMKKLPTGAADTRSSWDVSAGSLLTRTVTVHILYLLSAFASDDCLL